MKKDLVTHFSFVIAFFIFITIVRHWFSLIYLQFWIGGIIGTLLPDVDHLLYVYVFKPQDLTSQRVASMITQHKFLKTWDLLAVTRNERKDLVFHTAHFQLIFWIFLIFVMSSSGSLLVKGIVLAFALHLLIDEAIDFMENGDLKNWFLQLKIELDGSKTRWYLVGNIIFLQIVGFFL